MPSVDGEDERSITRLLQSEALVSAQRVSPEVRRLPSVNKPIPFAASSPTDYTSSYQPQSIRDVITEAGLPPALDR